MKTWLEAIRIEPEWQRIYTEAAGTRPQKRPVDRARVVESKIERLRISWESGARTDEAAYRRDVAELRAELDRIRSTPEPTFAKQARRLTSLADGWDQMRPDQRKRLLATMFTELVMKDGRLEAATPVPDWLPTSRA